MATTCTRTDRGRCPGNGTGRTFFHTCTQGQTHTGPHRCTCGHTWHPRRQPNTTPTTQRRGARRRTETS